MSADSSVEITRLLRAASEGNQEAKAELIGHVYEDLRARAGQLMRNERSSHTWGASDLVHEAYLRIFKGKIPQENRAYFFGAVARAMHQLLIEYARIRNKRPGVRVPFGEWVESIERTHNIDIEALDEALDDLREVARREYEIVVLRTFAGSRMSEIAENLNVCLSTVEKDWKWARSWLYTRLRGDEAND